MSPKIMSNTNPQMQETQRQYLQQMVWNNWTFTRGKTNLDTDLAPSIEFKLSLQCPPSSALCI